MKLNDEKGFELIELLIIFAIIAIIAAIAIPQFSEYRVRHYYHLEMVKQNKTTLDLPDWLQTEEGIEFKKLKHSEKQEALKVLRENKISLTSEPVKDTIEKGAQNIETEDVPTEQKSEKRITWGNKQHNEW